MRRGRRAAALLCALLLGAVLCGCGGSARPSMEEQVRTQVQGNLDLFYSGKADALYLEQVHLTEQDAADSFAASVRAEVRYFINYFRMAEPSGAMTARLETLYRGIYARADYTVGEAARQTADEYAVTVTVAPVDIIELAIDTADEALAAFRAAYAGRDVEAMTEEERAAYEADWAQAVVAMVEEQMPRLGHKAPVELPVRVYRDGNVWQIKEEDLQAVDAALIYYPMN